MASNSVSEIIGGSENGGGIPQTDDDSRAALAGGGGKAEELWMSNLDLGNHIFGIVALTKVLWITL